MKKGFYCILCALTLAASFNTLIPRAEDAIVTDLVSDPSLAAEIMAGETETSEAQKSEKNSTAANLSEAALSEAALSETDLSKSDISAKTETESEAIALFETEVSYDIPLGISDGLKKDTPTGEAAKMTDEEREALIREMYEAASPKTLWERHEDVTVSYSLYDEEAASWRQYSCFFADPVALYSDDWTPGMEELRMLIYGRDDCMEDYTDSMRFVRFLNASGTPYRNAESTSIILSDNTLQERLLSVHRTSDALYVITQTNSSDIQNYGLPLPSEEDTDKTDSGSSDGTGNAHSDTAKEQANGTDTAPLFYSCLYLLDPETLEVQLIRITSHGKDGSAVDVRNITYSYDRGMSEFIKTGYIELLRHMVPSIAWGPDYVRTVKVTLDPGTEHELTYLTETLMGDAVSISLPEGYELYADEALTQRWVDNGNYLKDLTLWAAKTK